MKTVLVLTLIIAACICSEASLGVETETKESAPHELGCFDSFPEDLKFELYKIYVKEKSFIDASPQYKGDIPQGLDYAKIENDLKELEGKSKEERVSQGKEYVKSKVVPALLNFHSNEFHKKVMDCCGVKDYFLERKKDPTDPVDVFMRYCRCKREFEEEVTRCQEKGLLRRQYWKRDWSYMTDFEENFAKLGMDRVKQIAKRSELVAMFMELAEKYLTLIMEGLEFQHVHLPALVSENS
jgi:hypothetical protein